MPKQFPEMQKLSQDCSKNDMKKSGVKRGHLDNLCYQIGVVAGKISRLLKGK